MVCREMPGLFAKAEMVKARLRRRWGTVFEEEEEEVIPTKKVIRIIYDPRDAVYVVAGNLVCMARNGAEAYVIARAVTDACGQLSSKSYTDEEVRSLADEVSGEISKSVKASMETTGEAGDVQALRLLDKGIALLDMMRLLCPSDAGMRFAADALVELFERTVRKRKDGYIKVISSLAKGLLDYLKEIGQGTEAMRERVSVPAMQSDLRGKEELNIMFL